MLNKSIPCITCIEIEVCHRGEKCLYQVCPLVTYEQPKLGINIPEKALPGAQEMISDAEQPNTPLWSLLKSLKRKVQLLQVKVQPPGQALLGYSKAPQLILSQ